MPTQLRIESSRTGRAAIALGVVLAVACMVAPNLPPSSLGSLARRTFAGPIHLFGFSSTWNLFAPEPLPQSTRIVVVIRRADGSLVNWSPPVRDRYVGQFRDYRWRGLEDVLRFNPRAAAWRSIAQWVARQPGMAGASRVVEASVYRATAATPPPGTRRTRRWQLALVVNVPIGRGRPGR